MRIEHHVKETLRGLRYRVWSANADSYISSEMTWHELREFELVRRTRRVVENIYQEFNGDVIYADKVKRWRRQRPEESMADEELQQYRQIIGADVDVEIKTLADGMLVLTARIVPVPKKKHRNSIVKR